MSTSLSLTKQSEYRARMGMDDDTIVQAITEYAKQPKNYESGWSFVVEAWDRTQILEAIGCAYSLRGAVKALAPTAASERENVVNRPPASERERSEPTAAVLQQTPTEVADESPAAAETEQQPTEQQPKPARRSRSRKAS